MPSRRRVDRYLTQKRIGSRVGQDLTSAISASRLDRALHARRGALRRTSVARWGAWICDETGDYEKCSYCNSARRRRRYIYQRPGGEFDGEAHEFTENVGRHPRGTTKRSGAGNFPIARSGANAVADRGRFAPESEDRASLLCASERKIWCQFTDRVTAGRYSLGRRNARKVRCLPRRSFSEAGRSNGVPVECWPRHRRIVGLWRASRRNLPIARASQADWPGALQTGPADNSWNQRAARRR